MSKTAYIRHDEMTLPQAEGILADEMSRLNIAVQSGTKYANRPVPESAHMLAIDAELRAISKEQVKRDLMLLRAIQIVLGKGGQK